MDRQPLSPRPPADADGRPIGTHDMRDCRRTIAPSTSASPRRSPRACSRSMKSARFVADAFDRRAELVEWSPVGRARAFRPSSPAARPRVHVLEDVRLRLLRAGR
jgi:hypothetical protein